MSTKKERKVGRSAPISAVEVSVESSMRARTHEATSAGNEPATVRQLLSPDTLALARSLAGP